MGRRELGTKRRAKTSLFNTESLRRIPVCEVATALGFDIRRRTAKCILPGHEDRNPSFAVRIEQNDFRCFGCGRNGSVIDLVMEMLGLNFREACLWLVKFSKGEHISLRARPHLARREPATKNASEEKVSESDPNVYAWILRHSPIQSDGEAYLASRGISAPTVEHFQVGQICGVDRLLKSAIDTWGIQRLEKCGVLFHGSGQPRLVFPEQFLLFPFLSGGNVVYIQARRLGDREGLRWVCPRALVPPVYNIDVIGAAQSSIAICEGITDVLSAHELGIHAIGFLGAHARQPEELSESLVGRNVEIFGDADNAGRAFSSRLSSALASKGITVLRKRLPQGCKDLNEYLIKKKAGVS